MTLSQDEILELEAAEVAAQLKGVQLNPRDCVKVPERPLRHGERWHPPIGFRVIWFLGIRVPVVMSSVSGRFKHRNIYGEHPFIKKNGHPMIQRVGIVLALHHCKKVLQSLGVIVNRPENHELFPLRVYDGMPRRPGSSPPLDPQGLSIGKPQIESVST